MVFGSLFGFFRSIGLVYDGLLFFRTRCETRFLTLFGGNILQLPVVAYFRRGFARYWNSEN